LLDQLIASVISFGWLQWTAVFFNIAYVILAARQNIWCWVFGGVGVTLLFLICLETRLYSDASLQVFYFAMSIYGWIQWHGGKGRGEGATIISQSLKKHLPYFAGGLLGTLLLGLFWSFFDAALPYIDAFTTSFSIVATFLVARKIFENWWYWIVIDVVCFFVYLERGLPLIAFLFLIYTVLAIYGIMSWRKAYATQ